MTHVHACDVSSLEGVREGEQGVLRGIHEEQSRESFGERDKAKDPERGFRFFQRTNLDFRRNQIKANRQIN